MLLKKLIILSIISLIISHSIIGFTLFEIFRSDHKAGALEMIADGLQVSRQIIFKFKKSDYDCGLINIQWKDDTEFRYENKMFDLVKKEISNDSIYIYCVHDEYDSKLYSVFDKFIGSIFDDNSDCSDELTAFDIFLSPYYSVPCSNNNIYSSCNNNYLENFSSNLLEGVDLVITPPPQA